LLELGYHDGIKKVVTDLNALYKNQPALFEKQFSAEGFEWIDYTDHQNAVMSYIRKGNNPKEHLVVVCNFTPVVRTNYRIGIPTKGKLTQIFNTDDSIYSGSGVTNANSIVIEDEPWNGRPFSAEIVLPPLGVVVFKIE
jgi:1,4-alpha-glucan branching enzyme